MDKDEPQNFTQVIYETNVVFTNEEEELILDSVLDTINLGQSSSMGHAKSIGYESVSVDGNKLYLYLIYQFSFQKVLDSDIPDSVKISLYPTNRIVEYTRHKK